MAAKLTELYHKPSAVFTLHEGNYVGSLRAPLGIDLVRILDASSSSLARYGGHAGAAGCTIRAADIDGARSALIIATEQLYSGHDATPIIRVDTVLDIGQIGIKMITDLDTMRPF